MKRTPMPPRRDWLKRFTSIARSAIRPKRRTAEDQAEKFAREYGGEERRAFVASLPCLVPGCPRPSESAHVVKIGGGMSRKGHHMGIAPLCDVHHRGGAHSLHQLGPRTFERLHGVDLEACARATAAAWQARGAAREEAGATQTSRRIAR